MSYICVFTHISGCVCFFVCYTNYEHGRTAKERMEKERWGDNDRTRERKIFSVSAVQVYESFGLLANCSTSNTSKDCVA